MTTTKENHVNNLIFGLSTLFDTKYSEEAGYKIQFNHCNRCWPSFFVFDSQVNTLFSYRSSSVARTASFDTQDIKLALAKAITLNTQYKHLFCIRCMYHRSFFKELGLLYRMSQPNLIMYFCNKTQNIANYDEHQVFSRG